MFTSLMYILKLREKQAHVTQAYFSERLFYLSTSQGNRITIKTPKNRENFYKCIRNWFIVHEDFNNCQETPSQKAICNCQ